MSIILRHIGQKNAAGERKLQHMRAICAAEQENNLTETCMDKEFLHGQSSGLMYQIPIAEETAPEELKSLPKMLHFQP